MQQKIKPVRMKSGTNVDKVRKDAKTKEQSVAQALLAQYLTLLDLELFGFCAADCPPPRGNASVAKPTQIRARKSTGSNRERSATLRESHNDARLDSRTMAASRA
jgi:hypothetical protein